MELIFLGTPAFAVPTLERIVDAGTFSPNAPINHTFADVFSGYAYLGPKPNSCTVRVVRFKDGALWRAPGVVPRRQAE